MFDSHTHVAAEQFEADRSDVIKRAREAGVTGWMEIGTTVSESKRAIELAQQNDGVFASVGVHPSEVAGLSAGDWVELEKMLAAPQVKAIGEVGLDFHRGGSLKEQLPALRRFVDLALQYNLPVVWHVRSGVIDAQAELLKYLTTLPEQPSGVLHMFGGSLEQAQKYLARGYYISISGVVTFKNAGQLPEVAKQVPLDKLLVETDAPYVAPEPKRGQRNEPAFVKHVIEKVAALRGVSAADIERITAENAFRLFKIEKN